MADKGRKIETKSVQAFRGLESRTITKWEQEGWRLVKQAPGKLRTELTFERERPPLPRKALIGAGAALVVLAVIITVGVLAERNDPTAAAPASTAAPVPAPASSSPAPTDRNTAEPSESTEAGPLTVKNNRDLAALFKKSDYCDASMGKFADKYENQALRFDAVVVNVLSEGGSRYDILFAPGSNVNNPLGPALQYFRVNMSTDLGWTGSDIPDSVRIGTSWISRRPWTTTTLTAVCSTLTRLQQRRDSSPVL